MKILLSLLLLLPSAAAAGRQTVHHALKAALDPASGRLEASDRVTLAAPAAEFFFTLHKDLNPSSPDASVEELPAEAAARHGINTSGDGLYTAYRAALRKPAAAFTLNYSGKIQHAPGEQAQEYSRSFSETPGLISPEGCYLTGASGWYPHFEGALVTYRLETSLPAPYDSVAGGTRARRAARDGKTVTAWEAKTPQDDITLTCGKYTEYSRRDGALEYQAFLLQPDAELADRYLEATAKYVGFYSGLIGPYPYGKFALVENFWDTGYGMPSFTLLGRKVIRLPFIINTSYPHEILHNWWGNGVFVDYPSGNWCEGLTAYLADYLIAENRGKGRDYRMTTLQKYSDYVSGGKDFPLTEFRSRHSSASEAVGYGKALMVYHMLRGLLGDEGLLNGLRGFYADNKFKTASFADLRQAFEKITGPGRLKPYFDQWIERAGAPDLRLKSRKVTRGPDGYEVEFTLAQVQDGPAYALEVPVAFFLEGFTEARLKKVPMSKKEETYHYPSPVRPLRLEVDPEFDLFRRLNPLETPPTLSRLLGAARPALILPSGPAGEAWQALAAAWTKDKANLPEVSDDTALAEPPAAASYWVLGGENLLAPDFEAGLKAYGAAFDLERVRIENRSFPRAGHTFVFAAFNPADPAYSGALVVSGSPEKLPLLAAKLPHYGKYSWLVFDENMTSVASGIWNVRSSPLAAVLGGSSPSARAYPLRAPLAPLPSAFSEGRLKGDVLALASVEGGRAPGTPGHSQAAGHIEKAFKAAGLKPFAGKSFRAPQDRPGKNNLLGVAEGTLKKDEYLVLCAHYDHLRAGDGGIFPGADDNASGVAVLLELARHYARRPPARSVLFAAFDGEEAGRQGSKEFVAGLPAEFRAKVNAALNFDTVGRLGSGKILALGSGSSDKWVHILRGAGFVTGYDYAAAEDLDSSDQASFIEAGVPALQFFSGAHADYHKSTDTADKIDWRGLVKIAEFAREAADYLAGQSEFITRPAGVAAPAGPGTPRKASTGLVPDFSFAGEGVRAGAVVTGSPLAKAGLNPGDVVTKIGGVPVKDLRAYSEELKKFSPGQKIEITYLSGGAEQTAVLELAGR